MPDIEKFKSIAQQIEDHEIAEWVREQGGIELLKLHEETFMNLSSERYRYKYCARLLDKVYQTVSPEHTEERPFESREAPVSGFKVIREELDKRLMPPGMEWPRFEDGEKVCIGDEFMGKDGKTYTVKEVQFTGKCFFLYDYCDRKPQFNGFYGERVKRPKQDPIGADSLPIKNGDTVRGTHEKEPMRVVDTNSIEFGCRHIKCEKIGKGFYSYRPEELTHNIPAIGADGWTICDNDTVFLVDGDGKPLIVVGIENEGYQTVKVKKPSGYITNYDPQRLTHTKPEPSDSWECLEDDSKLDPFNYCKKVEHHLFTFDNAEEFKSSDLVRRAKALAERK